MNINFRILIILMMSLCAENCFANATDRLFMLRKGNHVAFILPVMHSPTDVEKDGYLMKVIEPVFRRATILYEELAQPSQIYPFAMHPCIPHIRLDRLVQVKLDNEYKKIKKYDDYQWPLIDNLQEFDFAKVMISMLGPINFTVDRLPTRYAAWEPQISKTLSIKYDIKRKSIEEISDFHVAYCELKNVKEKSHEINAIVSNLSSPLNYSKQKTAAYYQFLLHEIAESLTKFSAHSRKTNVFRKYPTAEKFLLHERNKIWVKKISSISNDSGVPFYGLGIAHLVNNRNGDGLIGLLQKVGFEVTLIHELSDLPQDVLSLPQKNSLSVDQ